MGRFLKRTFGEEMDNLIILNLITCALCLTVVCIGPAVLALTALLVELNDDRCQGNRIKEFFRLFKKKFVNGLVFEIILAAYVAILIMSQGIGAKLQETNDTAAFIINVFVMLGFFLAAIVSVCTSIVLSAFETSFGTGLWNGICLAFGKLPRSFMSALVVYGSLYLLYPVFWPVSAVFYVFLMISVTCVFKVAFMWVPLCQLLLDRDPKYDPVEAHGEASALRSIGDDDSR